MDKRIPLDVQGEFKLFNGRGGDDGQDGILPFEIDERILCLSNEDEDVGLYNLNENKRGQMSNQHSLYSFKLNHESQHNVFLSCFGPLLRGHCTYF